MTGRKSQDVELRVANVLNRGGTVGHVAALDQGRSSRFGPGNESLPVGRLENGHYQSLARVIDHLLLRHRTDGRLLDSDDQMPSALEANQLCARTTGSGVLSVSVELQPIVGGMEYHGLGPDRSDSFVRHGRLVIENGTG